MVRMMIEQLAVLEDPVVMSTTWPLGKVVQDSMLIITPKGAYLRSNHSFAHLSVSKDQNVRGFTVP